MVISLRVILRTHRALKKCDYIQYYQEREEYNVTIAFLLTYNAFKCVYSRVSARRIQTPLPDFRGCATCMCQWQWKKEAVRSTEIASRQ